MWEGCAPFWTSHYSKLWWPQKHIGHGHQPHRARQQSKCIWYVRKCPINFFINGHNAVWVSTAGRCASLSKDTHTHAYTHTRTRTHARTHTRTKAKTFLHLFFPLLSFSDVSTCGVSQPLDPPVPHLLSGFHAATVKERLCCSRACANICSLLIIIIIISSSSFCPLSV